MPSSGMMGGLQMAAERRRATMLTARRGQPLIGIVTMEEGQAVTRYFTDTDAAGAAVTERRLQRALSAIGAWSDLDWDEMETALDRIRHESEPTPPIDLDDL
jgi:hypothetical protein